MAGDKDIQTQDQTYQVLDCCAVVDDNMGYCCSSICEKDSVIQINGCVN